MNICEKLELIAAYYGRNRGVGHSQLLMQGANNYNRPFFILAHNQHWATILAETCEEAKPLSWAGLRPEKLQGAELPIAIDNAVLLDLCNEAAQEIGQLKRENIELKQSQAVCLRRAQK